MLEEFREDKVKNRGLKLHLFDRRSAWKVLEGWGDNVSYKDSSGKNI